MTPLMLAIAATIRQIPRGRVSTYGAIAKAAGYPRCSRHVARVLNQLDGLPWQRVLGSGGRISLSGELAMEQRFLLEAEGVRFRGRKADLARFEHKFASGRPEYSGGANGSSKANPKLPAGAKRSAKAKHKVQK